jgi:hypothetical protein
VRTELERLEVPHEQEACARAWGVVQAAFAEREPALRQRSWKPLAALAVALAVLAGLLSPPGRAVLDEIREVVGVEESAPALFSLPAPGRMLVTADSGAWVVEQDGSKRLLGAYREASWSPFGRFVVASRRNELAALTPDGDLRWSLARPDVRFPRWGGTETDTRIAYLSDGALRVVGGDGTGDRLLDPGAAAAKAPVWEPGRGHRLAYARRDGSVRMVDVDSGAVLDADAPEALVDRSAPRRVELRTLGGATLGRAVGSPDGRWVAVGWPEADQFVFFRAEGQRQIRAISDVSAQFRSRTFPRISGWCCAP